MARTRFVGLFTLCGVVLTAGAAAAQSESALRAAFEGKTVTLKLDMPGTNDGVDVAVDRRTDFKEYGDRIKRYGVAIHAGDRVVVTLVKVKKDLIEFQLAGGGYGTFGDDTSTSVDIPFAEKSPRELDLEKQLKDEKDPGKRRMMQRDLDDMRAWRERENRRITAERAMIGEYKKRMLVLKREQGGSRFNLRFERAVPAGITADDVRAALEEYVDFAAVNDVPLTRLRDPDPQIEQPRRGMLHADAERAFGVPVDASQRREGSLTVVTLTFLRGDDRITAEFVEDVMIRFVIGRR